MMIKYFVIIIIILCIFHIVAIDSAWSRSRKIGLGLIIGEPTGFSFKNMNSKNVAIDGAFGWSFDNNSHIHIHGDILWHNWQILQRGLNIRSGALPLYYGIGVRGRFGDISRVGVRFVIGISYLFEREPFDLFLEVAPIMDFAPRTEFNGNAAIGVRYWF